LQPGTNDQHQQREEIDDIREYVVSRLAGRKRQVRSQYDQEDDPPGPASDEEHPVIRREQPGVLPKRYGEY
jgi:hypothetical protein